MNRTTLLARALAFCIPMVALAWPAAADTCQPGSLASYIALDETGGCTVGDFTFFRFSAPTPDSSGNPPVASNSQIMVTPEINSTGVGFSFTASSNGTNLFAIPNPTQNESVTYHINYTLDPLPVDTGQDLSMDPPFGNVSVTQRYCLFDVFADGCESGLALQQTVTTGSPHSFVAFPTPASFVDIQTDITLSATPGNPAGFDGLDAVASEATPEPASVLLAGAGFAVLYFLGRNRKIRTAIGRGSV